MKRIVILIFLLGMTAAPAANTFRMLQSNVITGLIPDIEDGYGVAFRDFNNDRLPDIYLVCFRNLNRLLINNGGIVPFVDRTIFSGLGGNLMPRGKVNLELGASAADYDNDGLPDLFIAGWGKAHALFHNEGNLRFTDATGHLNLHGIVDANQGLWLDADNDGYLDLYITDEHHSNRFLHNEGNGYFDERVWTEEFVDSAVSQGGCVSDFD
ncbi:MAG TPA: VCBS repeat-containing protein, partial [Caldithrix abyssi]|nr:VCBS repeat-containing protein [Caldithrix abyssi]